MSMRIILSVLIVLFCIGTGCSIFKGQKEEAVPEIKIIPIPEKLELKSGYFKMTPETKIFVSPGNNEVKGVADYFAGMIRRATGFDFPVEDYPSTGSQKGSITFSMKDEGKNLGNEGYSLSVEKNSMQLTAPAAAGLFYGVQTVRQLLPTEIESAVTVKNVKWNIPCVAITDKPRYQWRGMLLDVCRHFMPKEFVIKFIDYLAMNKMNRFHWHLTEDQGWRIEIKKYPELTEIGAFRKETIIGHYRDQPRKFDGKRHGGFYTQEDIKEVIDYAASRFITVIPEIEMPGHSTAALAAYPELSCTGGPFEVSTKWGVHEEVYCAGNDKVFNFLEDVLSEVIELFPSQYIHIGGDECPKVRWEECVKCQARIQAENLKDEHELQSYFIRRIEKFLNAKGKRLIGWDEILEGGLAPDATVMSWRGMKGGIDAAQQGHDVIMSPTTHCYFDYYQGDPATEPVAIGGNLPLKKVYALEPTPGVLTPEEAAHILGAQANLWTEYIATPGYAEYMTFPRVFAVAEAAWSPREKRDWNDFYIRVKRQIKRLDLLGINYSKSNLISEGSTAGKMN